MLTAPPPPTLHAAPPPPAAAATHLPTLDFECYSEAGYVRNLKTGGWDKLGPKGGIADVGAWAYSRHPSTEIIWLAYDLLDGNGVQSWFPWLPAPQALFDHVVLGGLLEAHNSFFEYAVWNNVFRRQCGAPKLPIRQLRDSAAVCAAYGLPRSLEKAGEVLGLSVQKDVKAAAKVKKLWVPRKPTKNNPATRITIDLDTELHMLNGSYCETDVRAEQAISATVPPLSDYELRVQQLDQLANARGVHIDRAAVDAAAAVIDQLKAKYVPMQYALTGGLVKSPNSYAALKRWVCDQGVDIPDTQADTITATLKRKDLPPVVREVLEIQQMVGGAAIKKIFAMQRFADPDDDRVRGVFSYCGASSTGRWASRGVQLHNNPNSGPDHYKCVGCGIHFSASHEQCPLCGGARAGRKEEWSAEAAESAIALIMQRDAELLERVWVNALDVITASIRGFICAAEGHDLICADYSAIEARVIAVLAGEEWRLESFRNGRDIYLASASAMLNTPYEEYMRYKAEHGSHHPHRKKGKVAELACLGPDTLVLTNSGYVKLVDIKACHKLWDGDSWVTHQGLVERGHRDVLTLDGVLMTPDHLLLCGEEWVEAQMVRLSPNMTIQALGTASASLPLLKIQSTKALEDASYHARAGRIRISPRYLTCTSEGSPDVATAVGCVGEERGINTTIDTNSGAPTPSTVDVSLTDCAQPLLDATLKTTRRTAITAHGVLQCAKPGELNSELGTSLSMSSPLKAGTNPSSKWIVSTSIKDTNPEISDSCLRAKTRSISGQSLRCKNVSTTSSLVYDIAYAGAKNRYTIKTDSGHMIVHNCGYQGGVGAMLNFGADSFMTRKEMKDTIRNWRDASPNIVKLWHELESCARQAIQFPGQVFSYRLISYQMRGTVLYARLPSGRELTYHNACLKPVWVRWEDGPEWDEEEHRPVQIRREYLWAVEGAQMSYKIEYMKEDGGRWVRSTLYGGLAVENVVQATARDLLADALLRLEAAGYPVIMHVHDEVICEVPHGVGSAKELEEIMEQNPSWAAGWPIKADGGWRGLRYRK